MTDPSHKRSSQSSGWLRIAGYAVHLYTASGAVCALLTAQAIFEHQNHRAFGWMILAVLIDATDGTLARAVNVRERLPQLDGARLDDIVDYLNYTFLPVLMMAQSQWLPDPVWLWASFPLVASLFAFIHQGAKEAAGFFRGFPSYWNIVAFYVAIWLHHYGVWSVLAVVLFLSLLSIVPVRFVYPNRAPQFRWAFLLGGAVWLGLIAVLLFHFPDPPAVWTGLSLVYPVFYVVSSLVLDWKSRRAPSAGPTSSGFN